MLLSPWSRFTSSPSGAQPWSCVGMLQALFPPPSLWRARGLPCCFSLFLAHMSFPLPAPSLWGKAPKKSILEPGFLGGSFHFAPAELGTLMALLWKAPFCV